MLKPPISSKIIVQVGTVTDDIHLTTVSKITIAALHSPDKGCTGPHVAAGGKTWTHSGSACPLHTNGLKQCSSLRCEDVDRGIQALLYFGNHNGGELVIAAGPEIEFLMIVMFLGYRHQSLPCQGGYSHRSQERGFISASPCEGMTLTHKYLPRS